MARCPWCGEDPLYQHYHDHEWGVPLHDDRLLFEFLCLEGAQAGLSWRTVLEKRAHYRAVYRDFDIDYVADMSDADLKRLLGDPGIIRNRLKVNAMRENARAARRVISEEGSLDAWLWSFVDGSPIRNRWKTPADVPAHTPRAEHMSKSLKKRGFRFVGPTICYAFMQATGMVNDHLTRCFRHDGSS